MINSHIFNSEFMNKLLNPLMKFPLFLRYKNENKYFKFRLKPILTTLEQ